MDVNVSAAAAPRHVPDTRPTADAASIARNPRPEVPVPVVPSAAAGPHDRASGAIVSSSLVAAVSRSMLIDLAGDGGIPRGPAGASEAERTLKPYGVVLLPRTEAAEKEGAALQSSAPGRAAATATADRPAGAGPAPAGNGPVGGAAAGTGPVGGAAAATAQPPGWSGTEQAQSAAASARPFDTPPGLRPAGAPPLGQPPGAADRGQPAAASEPGEGGEAQPWQRQHPSQFGQPTHPSRPTPSFGPAGAAEAPGGTAGAAPASSAPDALASPEPKDGATAS